MGSGKTSAIIRMFNEDPDGKYIFVTPYCNEDDRVIGDTHEKFKKPFNIDGKGKLEFFHSMLTRDNCIATTHALLYMFTEETLTLIREGGYTLVLDEEIEVFREYNEVVKGKDNKKLKKRDVEFLQIHEHITVEDDYMVKWNGTDGGDFCYSEVERLGKAGALRCVDNVLYWELPVEMFEAFEKVYILTYLFEGKTLSNYMKMKGLTYEKLSAQQCGVDEKGDAIYELCPYYDDIEKRREFAEYIDIYEGRYNAIGRRRSSLSSTWYKHADAEQIEEVKNMMSCYKWYTNATAKDIMWTVYVEKQAVIERMKGFKYIRQRNKEERSKTYPESKLRKLRCFVPCNMKGTNDFADRTVLMYMLNRFPNPEVVKYFTFHGCPIDIDRFALSEMIQWIWRSAIRKREPENIRIYIPSLRMRDLLYEWLGKTNMVLRRSRKRLK